MLHGPRTETANKQVLVDTGSRALAEPPAVLRSSWHPLRNYPCVFFRRISQLSAVCFHRLWECFCLHWTVRSFYGVGFSSFPLTKLKCGTHFSQRSTPGNVQIPIMCKHLQCLSSWPGFKTSTQTFKNKKR